MTHDLTTPHPTLALTRRRLVHFIAMLAVTAFALTAMPAIHADASPSSPPTEIVLDAWLAVGPLAVPAASENDKPSDLLDAVSLDAHRFVPADGEALPWPLANAPTWRRLTDVDELALPTSQDHGQVAMWSTEIDVERFVRLDWAVTSRGPLRLLADGHEVATKAGVDEADAEAGETKASLELVPGRHRLWIVAARPATSSDNGEDWSITSRLEGTESEQVARVSTGLGVDRHLSIGDILATPTVTGLDLAPDGEHLLLNRRHAQLDDAGSRQRVDLIATATGEIVRQLDVGKVAWSPDGRWIAYATFGDREETLDLWREPVEGGERLSIARDLEHLADHRWLPHGEGLLLRFDEQPEPDERRVKRYRGLTDRWSDGRDARRFEVVTLDGDVRVRVWSGSTNDGLQDLRPDGRALLIATTEHGLTERPFSSTQLIELNLDTLERRQLGPDLGWFDAALYAPDGRSLVVLGSPSLFGGVGERVPDGAFANDYEGQAFLLDPETGAVRAISADFDPAILEAHWPPGSESIVFHVQDGPFRRFVTFDPGTETYTAIEPGTVEVATTASVSASGERIAFLGTSSDRPHAVYLRDLSGSGGEPRLLLDPDAERFAGLALGAVEDFSFTFDGEEIVGRVHYPPDFDPSRRWPAIVNYYGGVVPTSRTFGGRYPKHFWAANGYVVLVLQPSGAAGFGQERASRHANDWGRRVGQEILAGVEAFVSSHPFIDPDRLGCIGASYGGFMTQYLISRSNRFAAAVSHAGISNLTSYWGAGNWGYLYKSAASAESYPWNAPELYVDQSPLFSADDITTPLLLLHGDADTNVPADESQQMYTALRVLGRDVELIEIEGQDHWILEPAQRRLWSQTIVAWFDRYLKDDPALWDHLWEGEGPRG
ncbi:MAG: S9 family peptidase [Acidobacteriota bacterium]